MLLRVTGDIEGPESGMMRLPVMVSEGKREEVAKPERISYQIWKYASYCFEEHARLRKVIALEWEGRL